MKPADATALHMIERAAERGDRCPTNSDISVALGCYSTGVASAVVSRLERAGFIVMERGNNSRVATVISTGKRTAGVVGKPHWRTRPENRFRQHVRYMAPIKPPEIKPEPRQPNTTRVFRDPCPRCGTRADIGCEHGWKW